MNTALCVLENDPAGYAALPDKLKDELGRWFKVIDELETADKITIAAGRIAERMALYVGFSRQNILRRYYAYKQTGDWHSLVNAAKLPRDEMRLPPEFVAEWQKRCMANQRKMKPAYRELIRDWRRGESIPGYGVWQEYWSAARPGITFLSCPTDLPSGWTYENLWRYRPTKGELAAARQGRGAFAGYRPKVMSTRVGLKVGQYIVFDDVEHDLLVNVIGTNRKALRPLELGALDLFSACKFFYGTKPTLQDELEEKKIKLKEREMRFLLAVVLTRHGYRADGTVLLVEHGTAAIREDVEDAIARVTNGAIRIDRSGIGGAPACDAFFEGRPIGNSRFKAALESHWNLTHNETAALPGQLGKDRDHAPEELHGLQRYNTYLLNAVHALPPERAAMLRFHVLNYDAFCEIYARIVEHINSRTEHELEGWEQSGLTVNEYEIAPGLPLITDRQILSLPEDKQIAMRGVLRLVRGRKMSPREVYQAGAHELVRLPAYLTTEILGPDLAVERRLGDDSVFEFEDRDLGPGAQRYLGVVQSPDGRRVKLAPGETYLTYCNPFAGDALIVCSAARGRGGVIGIAPKWDSVSRTDLDAVHRRMGEAKALEREALLPVARAGADKARELVELRRHNAEVARGLPITGTEHRQLASDRKRLAQEPDDFTAFNDQAPATEREASPSTASMDELNEL